MAQFVFSTLLLAIFSISFLNVGYSVNALKPILIDTPELLEQFRTETMKFRISKQSFLITPGAHPAPLSLPHQYTSTYTNLKPDIKFTDSLQNAITLLPNKRVWARLRSGNNLMQGIPHDYEYYTIELVHEAILTDNDFNSIMQWINASGLTITAYNDAFDSDIVNALLKRVDQLKMMTRLKHLRISLHPHSFNAVQIIQFMNELPSLSNIAFGVELLNDDQIKEFFAAQKTPGWIHLYDGFFKTISYNKADEFIQNNSNLFTPRKE